jgi:hypothetical protein
MLLAVIPIESAGESSYEKKRNGDHEINAPVETNCSPNLAHFGNGFFA